MLSSIFANFFNCLMKLLFLCPSPIVMYGTVCISILFRSTFNLKFQNLNSLFLAKRSLQEVFYSNRIVYNASFYLYLHKTPPEDRA